MNIVKGSMLRANVNIIMRRTPDLNGARVCTVQKNVLVKAFAPPANNWLHCQLNGWESDERPGVVFSEPNTTASIEARRGLLDWRNVQYIGYCSMLDGAWWTVVDGRE